jgi:hypothetical protein
MYEEYKFMKNLKSEHSTTRHLAYVLATTASMQKWCVYFFGDTQTLPEEERFKLFRDALNAPQKWGMTLDGVEWNRLYEFCKDPFRKEEKMVDKNDQRIKQYCDSIKSLLIDLIKEQMAVEAIDNSDTKPTRDEWVQIYEARAEMAANRLSELRKLKPPDVIMNIHSTYINAFSTGLEARQEEARGNFFKASAVYKVSSDLLGRAETMLKEMGIEYDWKA